MSTAKAKRVFSHEQPRKQSILEMSCPVIECWLLFNGLSFTHTLLFVAFYAGQCQYNGRHSHLVAVAFAVLAVEGQRPHTIHTDMPAYKGR